MKYDQNFPKSSPENKIPVGQIILGPPRWFAARGPGRGHYLLNTEFLANARRNALAELIARNSTRDSHGYGGDAA